MSDASKRPNPASAERPKPTLDRLQPKFLDLDGLIDDLRRETVVQPGGFFGASTIVDRPLEPEARKVVLAVSGGGAAGAYSAGALDGVLDRFRKEGVKAKLLVGTSAGALNSFGVFLEELGMENPQLANDPELKQPYSTFIASIWSYLDRHHAASAWIVGRRAWMLDMAVKGVDTFAKRFGLVVAAVLAVFVFNPFLFVSIFLFLGLGQYLPEILAGGESDHARHLAALGLLSLAGLGAMVYTIFRVFRRGLFRDTPLLRLLANTGPGGDLSRRAMWPHEQTADRARVLSRDIVREWYSRRDELPELVITTTNITLGRECLFTLVRPETYRELVSHGWMAVQLDSQDDATKAYRESPGALFTLPENLIHCIVASTAVPSAFPTQHIGLYGPNDRKQVRHSFVDGGVLNNSPVHLSIDAGATHIISFELEPLRHIKPLDVDDHGEEYNVLEAGVTTFSTLLQRAIERDVRRTVTWNRFLTSHPESLANPQGWRKRDSTSPQDAKRIINLYRIAPEEREIGTAEFDGHYENGKRVAAIRDLLQRGVVDLRGAHIWRASLQSRPGSDDDRKRSREG